MTDDLMSRQKKILWNSCILLSSLPYEPALSSFNGQPLNLKHIPCVALICLFRLPLKVYEAIMKESDLNDLESKHMAKKAKHSQNDTW